MNHCLFKAKDTKGAVGNTVDYSSLTIIGFRTENCVKLQKSFLKPVIHIDLKVAIW